MGYLGEITWEINCTYGKKTLMGYIYIYIYIYIYTYIYIYQGKFGEIMWDVVASTVLFIRYRCAVYPP